MGICISIDSVSVSPAKLILQDGQLLEFSYPVSVAYVLQKNPECFICNSDEMEFDVIVTAIDEDEDLQLGQLYFALPISRLSQPLQPEEMGALAVKASAALMRNGDGLKGLSTNTTTTTTTTTTTANKQTKPRRDQVANSCSAGGLIGNKTGENRRTMTTTTTKKSTGGKGRKFASQLGAIPE